MTTYFVDIQDVYVPINRSSTLTISIRQDGVNTTTTVQCGIRGLGVDGSRTTLSATTPTIYVQGR